MTQATATSDGRNELAGLLDRVNDATGPDREIDCLIAVALDGFFEVPPRFEGDDAGYGYFDKEDGTRIEPGQYGDQLVWSYTDSIDAALALVERKLPNAMKRVLDTDDGQSVRADIVLEMGGHFIGYGATWPLAILAALLTLISTQEPTP